MNQPTPPTDPAALAPPTKNIVICLDGTSNQIGSSSQPTNVAKVFEMLDLDDPSHQVAYYDPGVGTLPATGAIGNIGRGLSMVRQLAFGSGMKQNISQAYGWLMDTYQPGDRIYIFGFSRGAYTARAFAAMLGRPGLLRSGSLNLVDYAVREYTRRGHDAKANDRAWAFADATCWGTEADPMNTADSLPAIPAEDRRHAVPVEYLGVWDTVKAAGFLGIGRIEWPDIRTLWNVRKLRHAVSLDERRRPFREYLVQTPRPAGFAEAWFAGVHTDVGGTHLDEAQLSTIALKWVIDPVAHTLLLRDKNPAKAYSVCQVTEDFQDGPQHSNGHLWDLLLGPRARPVPADAQVHHSVRARRKDWGANLRKLNLADDSDQWIDPDWCKPVYPPPVG